MSLSFLLLRTVNASVNVFDMKLNFSTPKIYTGGVLISEWSNLTELQKEEALNKDWFVYYSYRDPRTQKLKRQPHIKAGVNKLKTKRERLAFLRTMQKALLELLQAGFNPYQDNSQLEAELFGSSSIAQSSNIAQTQKNRKEQKVCIETQELESKSITEAFKIGLSLKERLMNKNSFTKYKSRINRFSKWLKKEGYEKQSITTIHKKLVIEYLNEVLQSSSARNRNNTRTDIASLFQILEDNELITENFVKKISVLKSTPTRNKTYTPKLQEDIYNYLKEMTSICSYLYNLYPIIFYDQLKCAD